MPQVIITVKAAEGMERCRLFLASKSTGVTRRAAQAIQQQLLLLKTSPNIGRPLPDIPELQELVIYFGDSGYVALYRYEPKDDTVYILAFRHQKEASY